MQRYSAKFEPRPNILFRLPDPGLERLILGPDSERPQGEQRRWSRSCNGRIDERGGTATMAGVNVNSSKLLLLFSLCLLGSGCSRKIPTTHNDTTQEVPIQAVVDSGCPHQRDGSCEDPENAPSPKDENIRGAQLYGAPLGQSPRVSLSDLIASPDSYHDKLVRVDGNVRRVCTRRGCWMEIAGDTTPEAQAFRVTFKDYGFLVPVDSLGKKAQIEGLVQITTVEKSAVDHYESEGAIFPNKRADGTAREVRLVATGVELSKS